MSAEPKSVTDFMALDNTTHRENYSISQQLKTNLNAKNQVNVCLLQTQANSPMGYLPQALAIAILRPFNAAPILMDYLARLFILATWTILIALGVKIIPVRKWTLVGIALLPIAIQQSISIGADVLSIAPAVLFMAILVRSYYEDRTQYSKRDMIMLAALAATATLSKPVMIALIILPFFYHYEKTHNSKPMHKRLTNSIVAYKALAILAPLVVYIVWDFLASQHKVAANDVYQLASQNASFLRDSPLAAVVIFVKQLIKYIFYGFSFDQFGAFSWFTYSVPQTWRYLGISTLLLILLISYGEASIPLAKINKKQVLHFNLATLITAIGVLVANILTLYIIWTPRNAFGVQGVQFRYFLPVFFIAACIIETKFLRSTERWYRNFVLANSIVFFAISALTLTKVLPTI